ncbi:MAG TPA: SAM-dependent methyltransferase [Blastocatellia bacterium]|nr:SAM-dependent methyltransferase [Blastocatellia bacterium]
MKNTSLNMIGRTSRWAAAQRARESTRSDRLFDDPLAAAMAGDDGLEMLRRGDEVNPQHEKTAQLLAVRTRFLDDLILNSTAKGITQIVILAAGLDCRAFRLNLPPRTRFYELDQAPVIELKEHLLKKENARTKYRRIALEADLTKSWLSSLREAGFQNRRSVWIMEGLLYYLSEPGVRRLLSDISSCAAAGSVLGADLVSASFLQSPLTSNGLEMMRKSGIGWQFGTDDPESFFVGYGWEATVLLPGEEGAHYGRLNGAVVPRSRRDFPHKFLVSATKN